MRRTHLNAHLVGRFGGRREMATPALVVELDALERNIAAMAGFAKAAGVAVRPHAKTHKCAEIARRQIAAGALGVCCAKLGEAEALADAGVSGLLITSPVVGALGVKRLAALAARSPGLMAAVDHPKAVEALAASRVKLDLVVDIDPGIHRTGVADAAKAHLLAEQIVAAEHLTFAGVQFYCGAQQHIEAFTERQESIAERTEYLSQIIRSLTHSGLKPGIVTGGGTGSHAIDMALGVFTELQVGSYVFMDRQYNDCDLSGDGATRFETSLAVDARVISASHPYMSTVDAGFKAFATEAGAPPILAGAAPDSVYHFMGDEHGCVVPPSGAEPPELGEVVSFAAPHCDPTVNLYDVLHAVRGGVLEAIWPIEARGRSA